MIKAILTDVDGVMVGKEKGVNYPLPNKLVIDRLKAIHGKGIPIILCTAKFGYAIYEIIRRADLRNPHITDSGAVIIDLLADKLINSYAFDPKLVRDLVEKCLEQNIYTECYTVKDYYVQESQKNSFTDKRSELLQKEPRLVTSLIGKISGIDIIKVILFFKTEEDRAKSDNILNMFGDRIHHIWSRHPALIPYLPRVVTVHGVSKKHASEEVLKYLGISLNETLGIGDSLADWEFMEVCKYVGTVGNESDELKNLVKKKGEGNYFMGSSVDENGMLEIFDYFKL